MNALRRTFRIRPRAAGVVAVVVAAAALGVGAPVAPVVATTFECSIDGASATPCPPGQQIQFAAGESSWYFEGGIFDTTQVWYFDAVAGQALQFNFQSADENIAVSIVAPSGALLLPVDYVEGFAEATLPDDGRYAIVLTTTTGGPYAMSVGIDAPFALVMGTYDRIAFAPGTESGVVANAVVSATADTWVFDAFAGQEATIDVTSVETNASFTVYSPFGEPLSDGSVTSWDGILPADGAYHVVVGPDRGNATYELTVTIPDGLAAPDPTTERRIEFGAGGEAGVVYGSLPPGGVESWVFGADAGQTAFVEVDGGLADVQLLTPSGEFVTSQGGDTAFQAEFVLPDDGDYYLFAFAPLDAPADYELALSIPADEASGGNGQAPPSSVEERISFDPGTSSAERFGSLADGATASYFVDAAAGQLMYVSVGSGAGNAVMTIFAPDGTPLNGDPNIYDGPLPLDGDYTIVVESTGGDADYNVFVEIL